MILHDAMRKGFKDAEFHRDYKSLTGEDPDLLMPEEMEKAMRDMLRDVEVNEVLKKFPTKTRFRRNNRKDRLLSTKDLTPQAFI